MGVEENKATILAYAKAYSRGDFDAVAALCTPDVQIQGVLGAGGLAIAVPIWKELHHAFAQELAVEEMVGEGDTVAVRYTERGTSRNPFRGGAVTGKSYAVVAMEWFKFRGGKIAQRWGARDSASIFSQMGLK